MGKEAPIHKGNLIAHTSAMNWENWLQVIDEPVEFEKEPVDRWSSRPR